ncbi:hypothetical protein BDV96DRAFT_606401 [Lophiotrema nucula]|uniref:Uncharacterized protein n=1 Tax=Lophiotrema nucula TaxID=690887 RepID=A0A6A5YN19_9PLEO|nr:hypothetical protein BDV96DRAFT_606401 [Lophiotrema nucula]
MPATAHQRAWKRPPHAGRRTSHWHTKPLSRNMPAERIVAPCSSSTPVCGSIELLGHAVLKVETLRGGDYWMNATGGARAWMSVWQRDALGGVAGEVAGLMPWFRTPRWLGLFEGKIKRAHRLGPALLSWSNLLSTHLRSVDPSLNAHSTTVTACDS